MTTSRTLGLGFAGLGLVAAVAGCTAADAGAGTSGDYADGTYTADGSYVAPSGQETVTVEITLADNVVTDVIVTGHANDPEARVHQNEFSAGIAAEVVGKDIDSLDVSRVGGSSLTSRGFNQAVEAIKSQAAQ